MLLKSLKILFVFFFITTLGANELKKVIYLTPDIKIPFWQIISRGVESKSQELDYNFQVFTSNNDSKEELINTINAINEKPSAIVLSPTNSSNAVTVLRLIEKANIPVVIADIGADSGKYVSYISSNNFEGAYELGKETSKFMKKEGIENRTIGIIAISQKRSNGKSRTSGFMKALKEFEIKSADIRQQVDFSFDETYNYTKELISLHPDMGVLWLQSSNVYKAAQKAIDEAKRDIYIITFDAEPEFLQLIPNLEIVASAMQQPYLMGEKSVEVLDDYLNGKNITKNIQLPVLAISKENIHKKTNLINRNVLGIINETK